MSNYAVVGITLRGMLDPITGRGEVVCEWRIPHNVVLSSGGVGMEQ